MGKIASIVNGNRIPFLTMLSIIITLIISSVILAGKISDIESSLEVYVDGRVEEKTSVLEYKIDELKKQVECNQKEIIDLIKGQ